MYGVYAIMHILVISALRRQRQKDQVEATLDYVVNSRSARATCEKLVENNNDTV